MTANSLAAACQGNIFLVVSSLPSTVVDVDTNLLVTPELVTLVALQASCTMGLFVKHALDTTVAGDSSNNNAYPTNSKNNNSKSNNSKSNNMVVMEVVVPKANSSSSSNNMVVTEVVVPKASSSSSSNKMKMTVDMDTNTERTLPSEAEVE